MTKESKVDDPVEETEMLRQVFAALVFNDKDLLMRQQQQQTSPLAAVRQQQPPPPKIKSEKKD